MPWAVALGVLLLACCPAGAGAAPTTGAPTSTSGTPTSGTGRAGTGTGGPQHAYRCTFNVNTDAFTGADGTASAIGWLGDYNSVITCLGGTFVVQDGPGGLFQNDGFGVYDGQRTTWADVDGYLPAQVTTFDDKGTTVAITEFADEVTLGGHPFVAVYSRVHVTNPTADAVVVNPEASPSLVPLDTASDTVPAHGSVNHDYVVLSDRFGADVPWPSDQALAAAGGFDAHFTHMRSFWNAQLDAIAQISVPDPALVDAYKSGFITTQIARSGNDLDTGRQRLRERVQPRRHRHPHQPVHPGVLHRRPCALDRGPQRGRRRRASTSTASGRTRCPGPST